jgi:hypothetical protein
MREGRARGGGFFFYWSIILEEQFCEVIMPTALLLLLLLCALFGPKLILWCVLLGGARKIYEIERVYT